MTAAKELQSPKTKPSTVKQNQNQNQTKTDSESVAKNPANVVDTWGSKGKTLAHTKSQWAIERSIRRDMEAEEQQPPKDGHLQLHPAPSTLLIYRAEQAQFTFLLRRIFSQFKV